MKKKNSLKPADPSTGITDKTDKTEGETEEVMLICQPYDPVEDRDRDQIPGTILRECSECHRPIWLAPSGQKLEKEHQAQLLCVPCGTVHMKKNKDEQIQILPEQIEEIKGFMRERRKMNYN